MQIRFSQLSNILRQEHAPAILICGDEPYQQMLAADKVRKRANELGFTERKIINIESGFDWSELESANSNISLFGDRMLIDLRIPTGKPGATGSKAIVQFIDSIHEDVMLMIQTAKLDRSSINSAWVKAINNQGLVLRIWPLSEVDTKRWINKKLSLKGYSSTSKIVDLIFQHVEGNLLAAMQEIEKLSLLFVDKDFDEHTLQDVLINSSHYSLNQLIDTIKYNNRAKFIRILDSFQKEDFALPLILWGMTEHIRNQYELKKSHTNEKVFHKHDLLDQLNKTHLKCIGITEDITNTKHAAILQQCAWVDRVIKGRVSGNPWRELLQLGINLQSVV